MSSRELDNGRVRQAVRRVDVPVKVHFPLGKAFGQEEASRSPLWHRRCSGIEREQGLLRKHKGRTAAQSQLCPNSEQEQYEKSSINLTSYADTGFHGGTTGVRADTSLSS